MTFLGVQCGPRVAIGCGDGGIIVCMTLPMSCQSGLERLFWTCFIAVRRLTGLMGVLVGVDSGCYMLTGNLPLGVW